MNGMESVQKIEFLVHYRTRKRIGWIMEPARHQIPPLLIIPRKIKSIPSPKLQSPSVDLLSCYTERVFCMRRTHLNSYGADWNSCWHPACLDSPQIWRRKSEMLARCRDSALSVLSFLLIFDASIIQSLGISHTQRPSGTAAFEFKTK